MYDDGGDDHRHGDRAGNRGSWAPQCRLRKDAGLVLEAAKEEGLRMVLTEAVAARLDEAIEAGHCEHDVAAVYRVVGPDHA